MVSPEDPPAPPASPAPPAPPVIADLPDPLLSSADPGDIAAALPASLEDVSAPPASPVVDCSSFVPSLGAWAKPLKCVASLEADLPCKGIPSASFPEIPTHLLWPSLRVGQGKSKSNKAWNGPKENSPVAPTVENLYTPEVRADGQIRFPWAAKMDPSTRNLFRTASPSYLEDGTPKVTIPSHLLLHGPENQKEYILGQFHRCLTPAGGLVNAVVNRIWGKKCRIFTRKLSDNSYLFHIPDDSTRNWILHRGLWHVDDCLMFVAEWSSSTSLSPPEISTVPVWVTLKNIPPTLYSLPGISRIASGLGEPMLTHKPRLDPSLMGEAKILVEVELDKPFPERIACDDKYGILFLVDVEYAWIPSKCGRCGHLGHKETRCLLQHPILAPEDSILRTTTIPLAETVTPPLQSVSPPHFVPPVESQAASIPSHDASIHVPSLIGHASNSKLTKVDNSPTLLETPTRFVLLEPGRTSLSDIAFASMPAPVSPATPVSRSNQTSTPAPAPIVPTLSDESSSNSFTTNEESQSYGDPGSEDEFRSRTGRHFKPTQRAQEHWTAVRGGKRGRGSKKDRRKDAGVLPYP